MNNRNRNRNRNERDALANRCPTCDAAPTHPCRGERGQARRTMHVERVNQLVRPLGAYLGRSSGRVVVRTMTPDEIEAAFG